MELKVNSITFIIVCFKSENVIFSCLNSLPKNSKKIVIENSNNIKLKEQIELKYDNIEVLMNDNLGMGASNNVGILRSNTEFVYILNPDTKFNENTFDKLVEAVNNIDDFAIISPLCSNHKFPNYKILKKQFPDNDQILEVDSIDGFSMLINKKKFNNFFDENIFLYLENDDICLRAKKNREKIYIIKNSLIDHLGASSSNIKNTYDFEYLRNWHWMWSKFYFKRKHYGYLNALISGFPKFLSSILKFLFYMILRKQYKREIYFNRSLGFLNALLGRKSTYRPKLD